MRKPKVKIKIIQVKIPSKITREKNTHIITIYEARSSISKIERREASLNLGVNNTVSMVDNIGSYPIVVKGGRIKSINQFYNKRRAKLISIKDKQGNSRWMNWLKRLGLKRFNKLHNIFHRLSRYVVEHCVESNIGMSIIGYNALWKQEVNMGKSNNQNFISILFWKLIKKIQNKAKLIGIKVILEEES